MVLCTNGTGYYRMPVEHLTLSFKPQSFFKLNPSMDVPGANDLKSVAAFGDESCCK